MTAKGGFGAVFRSQAARAPAAASAQVLPPLEAEVLLAFNIKTANVCNSQHGVCHLRFSWHTTKLKLARLSCHAASVPNASCKLLAPLPCFWLCRTLCFLSANPFTIRTQLKSAAPAVMMVAASHTTGHPSCCSKLRPRSSPACRTCLCAGAHDSVTNILSSCVTCVGLPLEQSSACRRHGPILFAHTCRPFHTRHAHIRMGNAQI